MGCSPYGQFIYTMPIIKNGMAKGRPKRSVMYLGQRQIKKCIGLALVTFIVFVCTTPGFQQFFSIPNEIRMFNGAEKIWKIGVPATAIASVSDPDIVQINGKNSRDVQVNLAQPLQFFPSKMGQARVQLKMFGKLPVKTFNVRVIPDLKVIPGGQSIGVKLNTDGMLVVGHHRVEEGGGKESSPAQEADIRVGDRLLKIGGVTLKSPQQVDQLVQQAGKENKELNMLVARGGKQKNVRLKPLFDQESKTFRLGLYIRNATSGVGTLTFYDPEQHLYGALGHVISDIDTGEPITARGGQIVQSSVTTIEKGKTGKPGEKRAIFFNEKEVLGNIEKNSRFGVFGKMTHLPKNSLAEEAIPVGLIEDVEEGPAQIYTVVEGQKVKKYDIEVVNVTKQPYAATKGLIIKVTDDRLLNKTGGIVQGMSGSPIIQNGKLVGAVTHVFVNDPTSGYGTHIEWMLEEAGIKINEPAQKIGA